jgi:uncharacterized protein YjiS (DUF1127 family)
MLGRIGRVAPSGGLAQLPPAQTAKGIEMLSYLMVMLHDRLDKRRRYQQALAEFSDAKYVHELVRDLGVDLAEAREYARRRIYEDTER